MNDKGPPEVTGQDDVEAVRRELEDLKALHARTLLEKTFLQRAVSDLDVHHSAHDGVIFADSEGRVVYANPYFLQLMGIANLSELLDAPLPPAMWADPDDAARLFEDVRAKGSVTERALSLLDGKGRPVFTVCSSVAINTDDGQFGGTEILLCNAEVSHEIPAGVYEQNALLEAIIAGAPHPVLVLTPSTNLLKANRAATALFRLDGSSQYEPLASLMRNAELDDDLIRSVQHLLEHGEAFRCDIEIDNLTFIMQGAPLRHSQAQWVLVLNDVSSLKELDTRKTQMLRMASHDLKNPLSIIVSYTQMLLTQATDEEQKTFLNAILQCTTRMFAIITDLLDLERAKAGQLILKSVELKSFVEEIAAEYETQIRGKRQDLTLEMPPEALPIDGDAGQLREALRNLLDNAIKYTPADGAIRITLRREGNQAHVEVVDTGCGIPQSALSNLFQPFFRVRTSITMNIPGTGLGLSLTKSIIEAHGGRIWVESQEGQGSRFFVDLPISQA